MKTHIHSKSGFTLVEIMIVVAIIGLLAAIAVPNFMKARRDAQRTACIANLNQLEGAKENWAFENKKSEGTATAGSESQINQFLKRAPDCPGGGIYQYGLLGASPTCSLGPTSGHTL